MMLKTSCLYCLKQLNQGKGSKKQVNQGEESFMGKKNKLIGESRLKNKSIRGKSFLKGIK